MIQNYITCQQFPSLPSKHLDDSECTIKYKIDSWTFITDLLI